MKNAVRSLYCFLVLALLAACAGPLPGSGGAQAVRSEKPRSAPNAPAEADLAQFRADHANFALDLYHALNESDENYFFSPYSIEIALAMAYAGARGDTAAQMAQAAQFTLPAERLHPAFNWTAQELDSRKDVPGQGADGKGFRLNVVNDAWRQEGAPFLPDFLDLLSTQYGAGMRVMDFATNPDSARRSINDYIAQKTENRIKDLLPEDSIDPLTRLVLTNAIYFNAAWMRTFEKDLTEDAPFTLLDGSTVRVPMMTRPTTGSPYLDGEDFQAVALPYENTDLSMVILVPDQGRFAEFDRSLDGALLERILIDMQFNQVVVKMPRFKIESSFSLKEPLQRMGMIDAFDPSAADLSGMSGDRDLYVSAVVHKAFVKVDEAGTEAAAATAVIVGATSAPIDEPILLTVDRPFFFVIRDEPTGAILFVGRVMNPAQ